MGALARFYDVPMVSWGLANAQALANRTRFPQTLSVLGPSKT